jgi:hypothetical protein
MSKFVYNPDPEHSMHNEPRQRQEPKIDDRHAPGTARRSQQGQGPKSNNISITQRPQQGQRLVQRKVEGGLTRFFQSLKNGLIELIKWSAKTVVSSLLGAALAPIIGPIGAIVTVAGAAAAMNELESLGLRADTTHKLIEPLQGKPLYESDLRKVIGDVLSEDRAANEDLRQLYLDLIPAIKAAAGSTSTNINISGPVQGLIVNPESSTITQTFHSFLQDNS